jgi:hypothetical protein
MTKTPNTQRLDKDGEITMPPLIWGLAIISLGAFVQAHQRHNQPRIPFHGLSWIVCILLVAFYTKYFN